MSIVQHSTAALLLLFLGGCDNRFIRDLDPPALVGPGEPAPAYAALSLAGDTLALADLRGEVVLLNAWATWCPPCVAELPILERLHRQFGERGFRVVGVSIDRDPPDEIESFLAQHGVTYLNLSDGQGRLERVFGWGRGVPRSLLIDRQGRIAHYWAGGVSPANAAAQQALADTIGALLR